MSLLPVRWVWKTGLLTRVLPRGAACGGSQQSPGDGAPLRNSPLPLRQPGFLHTRANRGGQGFRGRRGRSCYILWYCGVPVALSKTRNSSRDGQRETHLLSRIFLLRDAGSAAVLPRTCRETFMHLKIKGTAPSAPTD